MTVAVNAILDICAARFAAISTSNGYYTNVVSTSITRAKLKPFVDVDLPALNYWPGDVANSVDEYGQDTRSFELFVEFHTLSIDRPFTDIAGELAHDVVVALNRAPAAPKVSDAVSLDLGGVVSSLTFLGYTHHIGQGQTPWCGVLIRFNIAYATSLNNMSAYGV